MAAQQSSPVDQRRRGRRRKICGGGSELAWMTVWESASLTVVSRTQFRRVWIAAASARPGLHRHLHMQNPRLCLRRRVRMFPPASALCPGLLDVVVPETHPVGCTAPCRQAPPQLSPPRPEVAGSPTRHVFLTMLPSITPT